MGSVVVPRYSIASIPSLGLVLILYDTPRIIYIITTNLEVNPLAFFMVISNNVIIVITSNLAFFGIGVIFLGFNDFGMVFVSQDGSFLGKEGF